MTYNPDQPPSIRPFHQIESDVRKAKEEMAKSRAKLKGLRTELGSYPHDQQKAGKLLDEVQEALNQAAEEGE